jgi:pimeloyl-ACP methyl ester carboxylesterase
MQLQTKSSCRIAAIAVGFGLLLSLPSSSQEPWKVLPPTPHLPQATVSGYAAVNDIQMWYAEFGEGSPVLLLHGGPANSDYFGYLVPFLVQHHFRVIVADSRGQGHSTRSAQPFSYHLMATDVLALLNCLKLDKVDLVGWSDGGIIGIDIAINHPERLKHLFAFGANTDTSGAIEGGDKSPVIVAYLNRVGEEYKRLSKTPGQYDAFIAQIAPMWESEPQYTAAQLGTIRVPTTIADGQYDEIIKQSHDRYMASTIPGARLVILPNVSHFAMLQNPALFNSAVLIALKGH